MKSKYTNEELQEEALKYHTINAFRKGNPSAIKAARRRGIYKNIITHMPCPKNRARTEKEILSEALKYTTIIEFWKNASGVAKAALRLEIYGKAIAHMPPGITNSYEDKELIELALTCKTKVEFREKYNGAMQVIYKRKLQNIAFAHMPDRAHLSGEENPNRKYTDEDLHKIALKHETIDQFRKIDYSAYCVAHDRGIYTQIITHMPPASNNPYSYEELRDEALKYTVRGDFYKNSWKMYAAASARGILDDICKHMKKSQNVSFMEEELFYAIKENLPTTCKLRDRKVKIEGKPHIKGFDIDIFIPELKKGIEFDGDYHHSFEGMKRSKKNWPDEDIRNYHEIKDNWFANRGIKILHVKERDWLADKKSCIKRCLDFLNS